MRKILARGFVLEFVSFIALIIAVALAWLGDILSLSVSIVITASISISIAAIIWALKWELRHDIHNTMTLFQLLESIDDKQLYERGLTAIEECRIELENLSQGLLRIDPKHFIHQLIEISDLAKQRVRITHVGLDKAHLEVIRPYPENQWYQHNVNLVQRGILFERVFILPRSESVENTSQKLSADVADILNKHVQEGIKVYLVGRRQSILNSFRK